MAITFVQEAHADALSVTVSPTGTGNLLVVIPNALLDFTHGVTDDVGNTYVQATGASVTDSAWNLDVWYCANSLPGATTITVTSPAETALSIEFMEFSGTGSFDVAGNVMTDDVPLGPALTATQSGSVFISAAQPFDVNLDGINGGWTSFEFTSGRFAGYFIDSGMQQAPFDPTDAQNYMATGAVFSPGTDGHSAKQKASMFLVF